MQNWIAGAMAVLGTLLVLSGGGIISCCEHWFRRQVAGATPVGGTEPAPSGTATKLMRTVRRMPAADRLIGWGIVLLILGAVAAGAISFNLGANAGTR